MYLKKILIAYYDKKKNGSIHYIINKQKNKKITISYVLYTEEVFFFNSIKEIN